MKFIIAFVTVLLLMNLADICASQNRQADDCWKWIIPLRTTKTEIEKTFGSSIDGDKSHPFQTYELAYGKITVVYATETRRLAGSSCTVERGTVLNYSVSPRRLNFAQLPYDLTSFKKDASAAPRELVYFSESLGILIDTTIIELPDKTSVERVVMIEYHSPKGSICKGTIVETNLTVFSRGDHNSCLIRYLRTSSLPLFI